MKYDYMDAMVDDILEYIGNEIDLADYEDVDELEEKLNNVLWTEDSVTGNASGSYTFNRSTAQEYVEDNKYLVQDVINEDFAEAESLANAWIRDNYEYIDVTIRCCLLGRAIAQALEDDGFKEKWEEAHKDEEE